MTVGSELLLTFAAVADVTVHVPPLLVPEILLKIASKLSKPSEQTKPSSTSQRLSQPSPVAVPPSSHSSEPATIPSPHTGAGSTSIVKPIARGPMGLLKVIVNEVTTSVLVTNVKSVPSTPAVPVPRAALHAAPVSDEQLVNPSLIVNESLNGETVAKSMSWRIRELITTGVLNVYVTVVAPLSARRSHVPPTP